jgi:hypothetical protein
VTEAEVDPQKPSPPPEQNGQAHRYNPPGGEQPTPSMNPQQVIKLMMANGFAGWCTRIKVSRRGPNGMEEVITTPAQLICNLTEMLGLLVEGQIPVIAEDEFGREVPEYVNPLQAIVDLTAAIDESCAVAEQQMGSRKKRRRQKR